jgi:hypothetical protein
MKSAMLDNAPGPWKRAAALATWAHARAAFASQRHYIDCIPSLPVWLAVESDTSTGIAIATLTGRLELAKAVMGSRKKLRGLFNSVMIPPSSGTLSALVARKSLRSAGNLNAAADLIPLSAKNPCQVRSGQVYDSAEV